MNADAEVPSIALNQYGGAACGSTDSQNQQHRHGRDGPAPPPKLTNSTTQRHQGNAALPAQDQMINEEE